MWSIDMIKTMPGETSVEYIDRKVEQMSTILALEFIPVRLLQYYLIFYMLGDYHFVVVSAKKRTPLYIFS